MATNPHNITTFSGTRRDVPCSSCVGRLIASNGTVFCHHQKSFLTRICYECASHGSSCVELIGDAAAAARRLVDYALYFKHFHAPINESGPMWNRLCREALDARVAQDRCTIGSEASESKERQEIIAEIRRSRERAEGQHEEMMSALRAIKATLEANEREEDGERVMLRFSSEEDSSTGADLVSLVRTMEPGGSQ
ncbi:hypothetical protein CDD83_7684 [Cordyceps sp. RAO-2017]|nr:hypothetical protein CDD83_7684 [Cordyceps sp. RAO-2017]